MVVNASVPTGGDTFEPRRRFKPRFARKTQRTHDGGTCRGVIADCREVGRYLGRFLGAGPRREPEGTFCRNRSTGYRCAGDAGSAGGALRRLLRRLCEFRIVAGAAFARRSDPRHAGGLSQLSRSERLHGARAVAIPKNRIRRSGFRTTISWRSARNCAISASPSRSASSCIRRGRARSVISGVPHHRELIEAMLAYDLIGFQTEEDCENFLSYAQSDLGLVVHDGVVISRHGRTRAAVFPIGIDPQQFAQLAAKASTHPDVSRLRRSLNGEKLAIGVDRLDYSKGLINRIKAFDRMWTLHPQLCAHGVAAADRNALARRDRGLWQSAERGRQARQRRQRPAWRGRLDADPLSQQGLRPGRACGALSHRAGRRGDAVAGRHESRRQGICRRAKPGRSRRAGAVEIRRRRQRARYCADRQSARYRRHGAHHRDRAVDAADRTADALGSDDGEAARPAPSSNGSPTSPTRCTNASSTGKHWRHP